MKFLVYLFLFFTSTNVPVVFIYVLHHHRFIIDLHVVMMVKLFHQRENVADVANVATPLPSPLYC